MGFRIIEHSPAGGRLIKKGITLCIHYPLNAQYAAETWLSHEFTAANAIRRSKAASPAGHSASSAQEQLEFVETFIRCEGKISRMEGEIGLSYPTIRNRLHEVIRALGYEPGGDEPIGLSEDERQRILEDLDKGLISAEKAMLLLKES